MQYEIFGIIVTASGIWILKDPEVIGFFLEEPLKSIEFLQIVSYILIIAGLVAFFIGFLGCCGVCLESLFLLFCFAGTLIFPLILCIIVICVTLHLTSDKVTRIVEDQLFKHLLNKKFFNALEFLFKCCGVRGEIDYRGNITDSCRVNKIEIKYPEGCLAKIFKLLKNKANFIYGMTSTFTILIIVSIILAVYIRRKRPRFL